MSARILIIEDNPTNLELMSYLLNAYGYHTISAMDGESGLLTINVEKPDLIICDVGIPKINGLEVARRVKCDEELARIPMIAVTAFAMVGDREKVLGAGFDGYIPKPITPEIFVKQIEDYLSNHSQKIRPVEVAALPKIAAVHSELGTVLVVDNSMVNILLMISILEPSGYRVISSLTVDEGLARAKEHLPDLIISDIHLTGKDGFDFLLAAKADSALSSIPFVFLSSTSYGTEDARRAKELGAKKFIARPIDPAPLLDEIRMCITDE